MLEGRIAGEGGPPTLITGIILLVLAALGLMALADLVAGGLRAEPSVLGVSVPLDSADEVLAAAAVLGVAVGVALVAGIALLLADRRRQRERKRARMERDTQRLETVHRLLQERVEMLSTDVRELTERQAELHAADGEPTDGWVQIGTSPNGIVVLPEAPPERS